jgi:hypothetical protein
LVAQKRFVEELAASRSFNETDYSQGIVFGRRRQIEAFEKILSELPTYPTEIAPSRVAKKPASAAAEK